MREIATRPNVAVDSNPEHVPAPLRSVNFSSSAGPKPMYRTLAAWLAPRPDFWMILALYQKPLGSRACRGRAMGSHAARAEGEASGEGW